MVIDCDTGRDDALALWLALGLKENPVVGVVASYGNVALEQVVDNTARVLSLAGRDDIPLYAGAATPLRKHRGWYDVVLKRQASSGNGLCNLKYPPALRPLPVPLDPAALAAQIMALAKEHGPLDYVVLGPATNLAGLCAVLGDNFTRAIHSITIMGGRFDALWDENPVGDFNMVCDPDAVDFVLKKNLNPRFVPLNTTWPIALDLCRVEELRVKTQAPPQAAKGLQAPKNLAEGILSDAPSSAPSVTISHTAQALMVAHCKFFAPEPIFRFHDPAAVLGLLNPELFKQVTLTIECDDHRADFGRLCVVSTTKTGSPAQIQTVTDQDRHRILEQILDGLGLGF